MENEVSVSKIEYQQQWHKKRGNVIKKNRYTVESDGYKYEFDLSLNPHYPRIILSWKLNLNRKNEPIISFQTTIFHSRLTIQL